MKQGLSLAPICPCRGKCKIAPRGGRRTELGCGEGREMGSEWGLGHVGPVAHDLDLACGETVGGRGSE